MTGVLERKEAPEASAALMIDSIAIKNFRGFESAEANGLGRMNVIVGDNSTGKTALLEAIYLVCGNTPENSFKIDSWRGLFALGEHSIPGIEVANGSLWRDLFFRFDQDRVISIRVDGTQKRSLSVLVRKKPKSLPVGAKGTIMSPIEWNWQGAGNWSSIPRLENHELKFPNTPPGIQGAMLSTTNISASEMAKRYSELDIKNEASGVLASLREQFPEITALSTQVLSENRAMLYATIDGMSEKIPLPLVSAGIVRLLYILLTVHSFSGGAVAIDEIDSGLFHSRYSKLWESVNAASIERKTQVFASVHSAEALAALGNLVERSPDDFRLLRISRSGGNSSIKVISGSGFKAALAEHQEVRD